MKAEGNQPHRVLTDLRATAATVLMQSGGDAGFDIMDYQKGAREGGTCCEVTFMWHRHVTRELVPSEITSFFRNVLQTRPSPTSPRSGV